ncbi:MAG: translation elongation factor 4, partial [bacterium]|nr:translation elongation factor 4 [bacterium]
GYELNLIDTPGHADFNYEVSRSLAACEGALLVVDGSQGVQAQTLANVYLAIEAGLKIIPIINKIDLPTAQIERTGKEIAKLLDCSEKEIIKISAKEGKNIEEVLNRIISDILAPKGNESAALRALIFDSIYDEYRGVILYLRIVDGSLMTNETIKLMTADSNCLVVEVGHFTPKMMPDKSLNCGQIGYMVTNLKSLAQAQVGDTITSAKEPANIALPGYKKVKPYVYGGFFPISSEDYQALKNALEKLKLNDSALEYTPENSAVLGFGFRLGFLGLLHLEIVKERLEREYDLSLVATSPSVDYKVITTSNEETDIKNAADLPDPSKIEQIKEPWIKGEIITPAKYLGSIIQLIVNIRGVQKDLNYLDKDRVLINFESPLAKILTDFYDKLKSLTSGYGSFNYEPSNYRIGKLVRLDILVGGEMVDSLSSIVHRDEAYNIGVRVIEKLKEIIPRQQFEVSLQATIGAKIIARENIKPVGKNVTAKLYGGDVSRKNKLLQKQKKGKKRMKKIGKVEIPPEAFMVLVKKD